MEREDHIDIDGDKREWPYAEYLCDDCGLAARWRLGKGLEITFDPRTQEERGIE